MLLVFLNTLYPQSKNDTLKMNNGDRLIGEVKSMQRGILIFSTKYGDSDFDIEWDEIEEISTENYFFVTLIKGKHYYGWLRSSDSLISILSRDSTIIITYPSKIVDIIPINKGFKYRFNAEIDLGFGLAKSNNLRRITASGRVGYKSENWLTYISGNILSSVQDDADPIKRAEADLVLKYVIYNDWYLIPSASFLSSTEQQLNSRWNIMLGVGNYLIRSNTAYWGLTVGFNRNVEDYYDENTDRYSWEGYLGTELNLFDIGDLKLFTKAVAYPSLSEAGRWRFDGELNLKYELPLGFYVKIEFIMNYDNRPVEGAGDVDYVSTLGFGWEWDVD